MTSAGVPSDLLRGAAVSVGIGVVVALGIMTPTLLVPYYSGHYVCVSGPQIDSQFNWTPAFLINSPYGGWGNATWHTDLPGGLSGPLWTTFNGGAAADIEIGFWNLSMVSRVHVDGAGASSPCPAYTLRYSHTGDFPTGGLPFGGCSGCPILGENNTTDQGEPTHLTYPTMTGGGVTTSVTFANGFTEDNYGTISTCGGPGLNKSVLIHNLWFQVPVLTPAGLEVFNESVYSMFVPGYPPNSYSAEYWYWFPPNFGSWAVDNLSASGSPTGGWAFDYLGPCS